MSRRFAVTVATALALLPCSVASAATRYASPTGLSLMPCLQSAPCTLEKAQQIAVSGDTVQLAAGTYGSPGSSGLTDLTDGAKLLTITGAPGPAPVIWNRRAVLTKPGSKFSNLDLRMGAGSSQPNLLLLLDGTSADRVSARHLGPATNANACRLDGTITLTDSVCEVRRTDSADVDAVNMGGTAVVNPVVTLRNVTAVANAPDGTALAAYATSNDLTVDTTNVIAIGGAHGFEFVIGNQKNIAATIDHGAIPASFTVVDGGGGGFLSISANGPFLVTPQFVDQAGGDFHQLPSSPTVDTGLDSALNGPIDLDGLTRQAGVHTDIGAYERPTFSSLCAATRATGTPVATILCAQLNAAGAAGSPAARSVAINTYILTLSRAGLPAAATGPLIAGVRQLL